MKTHISKITGKEVIDYANKILIDAKLDKTSNKEIKKILIVLKMIHQELL